MTYSVHSSVLSTVDLTRFKDLSHTMPKHWKGSWSTAGKKGGELDCEVLQEGRFLSGRGKDSSGDYAWEGETISLLQFNLA